MTPRSTPHFTLHHAHRQPLADAFDGPDIVTDTGLLTTCDLDQRLGYLADLAQRLPDPRAQPFVTHSVEEILTQQVYQILADYADGNDLLRTTAAQRALGSVGAAALPTEKIFPILPKFISLLSKTRYSIF